MQQQCCSLDKFQNSCICWLLLEDGIRGGRPPLEVLQNFPCPLKKMDSLDCNVSQPGAICFLRAQKLPRQRANDMCCIWNEPVYFNSLWFGKFKCFQVRVNTYTVDKKAMLDVHHQSVYWNVQVNLKCTGVHPSFRSVSISLFQSHLFMGWIHGCEGLDRWKMEESYYHWLTHRTYQLIFACYDLHLHVAVVHYLSSEVQ